jgi:hypothetical protein
MTSDRSKGQQHVREAREHYKAQGMATWAPGNKAHFIGPGRVVSQSQDIAELFDFMAWNEAGDFSFVQVKSGESHSSEARTKIDKSGFPYQETNLVVMCRVPRKKGVFICWVKGCDGEWIRYRTDEE